MEIFKISSNSKPGSVAGALAAKIKQDRCVEIRIVGAAALNQAIKAVIICRSFLIKQGIDIAVIPFFLDNIENKYDAERELTGLTLKVSIVRKDSDFMIESK